MVTSAAIALAIGGMGLVMFLLAVIAYLFMECEKDGKELLSIVILISLVIMFAGGGISLISQSNYETEKSHPTTVSLE